MSEDTGHATEPDTHAETRQAARERFRERLAAAEQRMSTPGAWDRLREAHRAPHPTA